jgi:hypothetical protein
MDLWVGRCSDSPTRHAGERLRAIQGLSYKSMEPRHAGMAPLSGAQALSMHAGETPHTTNISCYHVQHQHRQLPQIHSAVLSEGMPIERHTISWQVSSWYHLC